MEKTKIDGIFASRLSEIMKQKKTTQFELSEITGTTRQAVSLYLNGSALPTVDKLIVIAKYFNVSSDYLLGLSEIKTTDTNIKAVCEYTGLSEDAVAELVNTNMIPKDLYPDFLDAVSFCITNQQYIKSLSYYKFFKRSYEIALIQYLSKIEKFVPNGNNEINTNDLNNNFTKEKDEIEIAEYKMAKESVNSLEKYTTSENKSIQKLKKEIAFYKEKYKIKYGIHGRLDLNTLNKQGDTDGNDNEA